MDCKKIFNLLDNERKINFKNRSELSDKLERKVRKYKEKQKDFNKKGTR